MPTFSHPLVDLHLDATRFVGDAFPVIGDFMSEYTSLTGNSGHLDKCLITGTTSAQQELLKAPALNNPRSYPVSSRLAAFLAAYHSPDLKPRCSSAFRKDSNWAPTEQCVFHFIKPTQQACEVDIPGSHEAESSTAARSPPSERTHSAR